MHTDKVADNVINGGWRSLLVLALMGGLSVPVSTAEVSGKLSEAEIAQINNTPMSAEQQAIVDDILSQVAFADVAPKAERRAIDGVFGVAFGQVLEDDNGLDETGRTLTVSQPAAELSDYAVTLTPETHQVAVIAAREVYDDEAACLAGYQAMVAKLKGDFPSSLVIYDDETTQEFYLEAADASIELGCDKADDNKEQSQLIVKYTSDQLGVIQRDERLGNQINPDMKPLAERQALQPLFGIDWNAPFQPEKLYPDNTVIYDMTPPSPDARFTQQYEISRHNVSLKPQYIVAKQDMADQSACVQQAKAIEQHWHEQYPHARWIREVETERYGAKIVAKNGRLSTSCFLIPEEQEGRDASTPYRLVMLAYDDTSVDDGYTMRPMAYDAMRMLSGEVPFFFNADDHHASYARVKQIAEQYRQLNSGN